MKSKIITSDFNTKLAAFKAYFNKNRTDLQYVDSYNGLLLKPEGGKTLSELSGILISQNDKISQVGYVLGLFKAKRIIPEDYEGTADFAHEYMNKENNLSLFYSVEESKIAVELPIVISKARIVSRHAILTLFRHRLTNYKIESLGLLTWEGDKIICDPIYWHLFY